MYEQLSLFAAPQPHVPEYSLVLAIFPDPGMAQRLTDLGDNLRGKHGMHGRLRPTSHLHVSLPLPNFRTNSLKTMFKTIDRVSKTVVAITCPFEINFDRVMSYGRKPGNRPIVLAGDDRGNDGVKKFHGLLRAEFAKYISRPRSTSKFNPHVTLLYDQQELVSKPIEPVYWTVRKIVLVLSEVGATKYHRLGSWALGG